MKSKKNSKRRVVRRPVTGPCPYCVEKRDPHYIDWEDLSRFVSERAKILSRDRSGICAKHQRKLATAVKRARHLALLPFKAQI